MEEEGAPSELSVRYREITRCGERVSVRVCDCGHELEGSGSFKGVSRTCGARVCPTCAWVRSANVRDFMMEAANGVGEEEGYEWQFLVLTTRYDPRDYNEMTWQSLRSRARLAAKLGKGLWNRLLKAPGAGMLRTVEVGKRGHVHANLLYYGPLVSSETCSAEVKLVDGRAGYVRSEPLRGEGQEDSRTPAQVGRVARYIAKGVDGSKYAFDEDWLAGRFSVETIDPRLAARWEAAVYRMQLTQRYGFLRGLKLDEDDTSPEEPEDDTKTLCPCCGQVGQWHDEVRWAADFLVGCHMKGKAGMRNSSWRPNWMHDRVPP